MTIARGGLKVKVVGQGQSHESCQCGRSDLDRGQFFSSLVLYPSLVLCMCCSAYVIATTSELPAGRHRGRQTGGGPAAATDEDADLVIGEFYVIRYVETMMCDEILNE